MDQFHLYNDIKERTNGEIYIGVVGPVRTGKSTFIHHFMELLVLPSMTDINAKQRAIDEMPQSATGKTITTTEPKFVPTKAAKIQLEKDLSVKVRMIDCVGYMVDGAVGHMEDDVERMVQTPWFDEKIPFTRAAEIGTDKVIHDHSTIGVLVTCDGSFGDLSRDKYKSAEKKTVDALKMSGKPFLVLLNSTHPYDEKTIRLSNELSSEYGVRVLPVDCENLSKEDVHRIMENVLYEFPVSVMEFFMPKWIEMLPDEDVMKQSVMDGVKEYSSKVEKVRDFLEQPPEFSCPFVTKFKVENLDFANGVMKANVDLEESYYFKMLSVWTGEDIQDEYELISLLREYAGLKMEYSKVENALQSVRMKGYGVVTPERGEITLNAPEIIKHGNKYGVKIKAESPSIHMIRANIETEIAPIVGTLEQAEDLITYISDAGKEQKGIWETNIFGKSIEQLVNDGITSKVNMINEESQSKLQDTMQKIVNDSNGGMVCIII